MGSPVHHRALYASFDRFPSRKGSAVHIDRFARTLFERFEGGLLYVLGGEGLPPYQREGDVEVVRFSRPQQRFLTRALEFGARLDALLEEHEDTLELCHFRDPWSGMPIVSRPHRYATVYEVNGLPSIELPFLYPGVPEAMLDQVRSLEQACLDRADVVVTPSQVTAAALRQRGVDTDRLRVIPNGAEIPAPAPRPPDAPPRYLLYFGALQPWQGVDTALRAFAALRDLDDLSLMVCASVHRRRAKPLRQLAQKLDVAERVRWEFALPEAELAPWREHAELSLAPLRDCSRNVAQGCMPLKILESMASGTPVVASDLPVVRELMAHGVHGRLVAPDRPGELARAIRVALDYPGALNEMSARARQHVREHFSWEASTQGLLGAYDALGRKADWMSGVSIEEEGGS